MKNCQRDEQQEILDDLESVVASVDPDALKEEIFQLGKLIDQARLLEQREVESKLRKLKDVLTEQGVFKDPKMKLLLFTEHKDTLDYLAGDGKDGRPLGKLQRVGPVPHPDSRRHEDRRSGHIPAQGSMQNGHSKRSARSWRPLRLLERASTCSSAGS